MVICGPGRGRGGIGDGKLTLFPRLVGRTSCQLEMTFGEGGNDQMPKGEKGLSSLR